MFNKEKPFFVHLALPAITMVVLTLSEAKAPINCGISGGISSGTSGLKNSAKSGSKQFLIRVLRLKRFSIII